MQYYYKVYFLLEFLVTISKYNFTILWTVIFNRY